MYQLRYLIFLVILVFSYSCKKECEDPNVIDGIDITQLPPATMTGANTMGCLINGEVWLPLKENILGDLVFNISFSVSNPDMGGGVAIQGIRDYNDLSDGMNVLADEVSATGIYPMPDWSSNLMFWQTQCGSFELDTTFENIVEITRIDFDQEIVSGLYQMRVANNKCDTITITEGRFDLSP